MFAFPDANSQEGNLDPDAEPEAQDDEAAAGDES